MKQQPFTKQQREDLIRNFEHAQETGESKPPVVKFFCPWGAATWLISEYDPETGQMFGLCDLGHGCPELGYVSLDDLTTLKGPFGLTIERDLHFTADKSLSDYADEARAQGGIRA